jgi:DNA-binding PadR family transcriptional regulator
MFYQQIIKGSTKFVILSMLEKQQMYGYELIRTAHRKTSGFFEWRESAVYPALHKMEKEGLLKSRWKPAGPARKRKYYFLTAKGKRLLIANRSEWFAFSKHMNKLIAYT